MAKWTDNSATGLNAYNIIDEAFRAFVTENNTHPRAIRLSTSMFYELGALQYDHNGQLLPNGRTTSPYTTNIFGANCEITHDTSLGNGTEVSME